ncbi:Gldg family protein [bacterium]|nr:Gldg family protein [bacterium]
MKVSKIQTTVGVLLVVAILVLINLIANTRFMRLDLTEDKLFSLSDASKEVVQNLDEPLTVKVFASENLSPQLNDTKRFLNDLLSGYRAYGGGKFRYEFIDPGTDEALEQEAQNYRIPPFQENVWEKDELQLKKVYLGAVFLYEDRQETIPTLQGAAGLEYNITSLIKRLTNQQSQTVGFLQGHGEPDPTQQQQPGMNAQAGAIAQFGNVLQSNYGIENVNLTDAPGVPDNIDVLMIVAPTEAIPEEDQMKIDQYIMDGGSVAWLLSTVNADLQNGTATAYRLGLDQMTRNYGFVVNPNLVADLNSSMINVQERRGFFTIQNTIKYPFFPNVNTFNENAIVVENIDMLSLFFPSSIDTTYAAEKNVNLTPVMYSGPRTLVQAGTFTINATQEWQDDLFTREHVVLGAMLEGPFPSAFSGMETDEGSVDMVGGGMTAPDGTRMFVMGDGRFIQDGYLTNPANVYMLLNAIDWLAGDTDLIALRGREFTMRTLKEISTAQKQVWKYVNWFAPPLLAILLGIVYWQIRRNRRYSEELNG